MHNRAIEQERRECRQRWVVARDQLRVWRNYLATQKTEKWYPGALKHHENVLAAARGRMREAAAARMTAAARVIAAASSSSLRRMVSLAARWRDNARTMDELADECDGLGEEKDAAECLERARTFRECAADLEAEWAGSKASDGGQRRDAAPTDSGARESHAEPRSSAGWMAVLSTEEERAVEELMQLQDLSSAAVLRQALRLYQALVKGVPDAPMIAELVSAGPSNGELNGTGEGRA